MNRIEEPRPEGLRARKRRATENAIETSAVTLAIESGVENVTVEAICEMADISRSTFFNYFSSRDHAIVGRAISLPEGGEAFSVLDSCPDDLPLGVFRLYFAAIGHSHVNSDVARLRARLVAEQPEAAHMTLVSLLESSQHLAATATAWLTRHPERAKLESPVREATLAVTLVNGVIATQMGEWMTAGSGDVTADEEDLLRVMREYRELLG
ncbi:TetR/AcrR family transcriptional regulator [Leucobacter sp. wl10]|uniref:TetR/AcrR family transcriptional regulator n=1 Tax=Leucobacter sp. wl10 TaxID=2304677 RepID=UPI000E5C1693|nr:TetR/AcrR family transcriptional regulator [Leucobacter sp. wl10]RGE24295.1 TetR family transcriptional regulator [Leucobacter sp. wl10]